MYILYDLNPTPHLESSDDLELVLRGGAREDDLLLRKSLRPVTGPPRKGKDERHKQASKKKEKGRKKESVMSQEIDRAQTSFSAGRLTWTTDATAEPPRKWPLPKLSLPRIPQAYHLPPHPNNSQEMKSRSVFTVELFRRR